MKRPGVLLFAVAAVALAVIGGLRAKDAADGPPCDGVRMVFAIELDRPGAPPDERRAAMATVADSIRERLDEGGPTPPQIAAAGDRVIVDVCDSDPEIRARIRTIVERTARLELRAVAAADPGRWDEVEADPAAAAAGIRVVRELDDSYLVAADRREELPVAEAEELGCGGPSSDVTRSCFVTGRTVLQRHLADRGPVDADLAYGFASMASDREWQTYQLEREILLDGSAVKTAATVFDLPSDRPFVRLELTAAAGARFADVTRSLVGRTLAIVLDGRVASAIVLDQPIERGRVDIAVAEGTDDEQYRDASDLVAVLKVGVLRTPPVLVSALPFASESALGRSWMFFAAAFVLALALGAYLVRSRSR